MKTQVTIKSNGYGHFKITTNYYNKEISCITTNTIAIDDARDGKIDAIKELKNEIIRKIKK
jgi:hypothetical protein